MTAIRIGWLVTAPDRQYAFGMMPESGHEGLTHVAAENKSNLRLLRDLQYVIHLDAEVSHSAFKLRVPQQQLDCTQILRALVNQRCFGSPHRVRAVGGWLKPSNVNPVMHYPGVLASLDMGRTGRSTWKEELITA